MRKSDGLFCRDRRPRDAGAWPGSSWRGGTPGRWGPGAVFPLAPIAVEEGPGEGSLVETAQKALR